MVDGQLSCDRTQSGSAPTASYILGPDNQQLTELNWSGGTETPGYTNVRAAGQLIAHYDPSGSQPALYFHFGDWLGTLRVLTDAAGNANPNGGTCIGLPYGDGEYCAPTQPTNSLFTGKERDPETGGPNGNDYFGARYYASTMGQFLTPDWSAKAEPVPYAKLDNPQSLNLYRYVFDNPLTGVDLDGHQDNSAPSSATDSLVGDFCTGQIASLNLANCVQNAYNSPGAGGESWAAFQASINQKMQDQQQEAQAQQQDAQAQQQNAQAQQQTPICPDCLQVGSNHPLASGGGWLNSLGNYLNSSFSSLVTAAADALSVAGAATGHASLGRVGAAMSVGNDHGVQNLVACRSEFVSADAAERI